MNKEAKKYLFKNKPEWFKIESDSQAVQIARLMQGFAEKKIAKKMSKIKPCKNAECSNPFMINQFELKS